MGDEGVGVGEADVLICLQIYFNCHEIIFPQVDQSFPDASDL